MRSADEGSTVFTEVSLRFFLVPLVFYLQLKRIYSASSVGIKTD